MKSKIVLIIVGVIIVLAGAGIYMAYRTGLINPFAATAGPTLALDPGSGSYTVDSIFDVNIQLDTAGQAASGAQAYLTYNPAQLAVQDADAGQNDIQITKGNIFDTYMINKVDDIQGKITISAIASSTNPSYNGSGIFATIKFKAKSASTTAVTFDARTAISGGGAGQNILASATGGTYTITGGISLVPTVSITANGADASTTIASGAAAELSWTSTLADSCTASNGWSGSKETSGKESTGNLTAEKTYIITCHNGSGDGTDSVTVKIAPVVVSVNIKANDSEGPIEIDSGTAATLKWSSTNADKCTASDGWSGDKELNNNTGVSTGNLTQSKKYTLTCQKGTGTPVADSVTVNVKTPSLLPDVNLEANGKSKVTIKSGESITLTWTSTKATTCTASGSWSGAQATAGSAKIGPLTQGKVYILTCANASGSVHDTATVLIENQPPPVMPTANIKANDSDGPITIDYDKAATLSWTTTNADSCTASNGWEGSKSVSGSESTGNLTVSKTYTLTCVKGENNAIDSVTVNVSGQPAAQPGPTSNGETASLTTPGDDTTVAQGGDNGATPTTTTDKFKQIYKGGVNKPWTFWVFYALIPLSITGGLVYFFLRRKRQKGGLTPPEDLSNLPGEWPKS